MANIVILEGFVTAVTPRFTGDGKKILSLTVATKERSGNKEYKEYHKVVIFSPLSDWLDLQQRQHVAIHGRLTTRKWDHKGETRYTTEVIAQSCVAGQVWESTSTESAGDQSKKPAASSKQASAQQPEDDIPPGFDDVPPHAEDELGNLPV